MRLCPNTSPLLILARIDRLDLLGDPADVVLTRAVLDETLDKQDSAAVRIDALAHSAPAPVEVTASDRVDVARRLGPGERSVLTWALLEGRDAVCVLDDAAARAEALRLSLAVTGTLGLILRAKVTGRVPVALPLLELAVAAGLYLDDAVLASALADVGESWPREA